MPTLRMRDGRSLHYRAVGRGPLVVLLHGFAMHGGMWLPSVLPLAGRYRFILPDLRGWGRSHAVPYARADVVRGHAEDVADLLAHLGAPVLLGGLSMGALTALALADAGGFGGVRGYLHIDQAARIHNGNGYAHGLFGGGQAAAFATLRALLDEAEPLRGQPFHALPPGLRGRVGRSFAEFIAAAVRPGWMKKLAGTLRSEAVVSRVLPMQNWAAYVDCLRAYLDERYDFGGALAGVRAPVTFMVGEASEMYPAEGQLAFARSIPGARVVRFPGVGHAIPIEAPVAFVRALAGVLGEGARHGFDAAV